MSLEEAAVQISKRSPTAPFAFVNTVNAQHLVQAWRGESRFVRAQETAWLVLNDSRILRLLAKMLFGLTLPLAAGSDLTVLLLQSHIHPDDPVTIIGGTAEVEQRLRSRFQLRNLARFDPPMGFYHSAQEVERCVDFIGANPAQYIFLAVGAPQSEMVACRVVERGGATGLGLCVGSSLHFATGVTRRAPRLLRQLNLEWAYRLMQNPRRHARRVFVESLPVLWIAFVVRLMPSPTRHMRRCQSRWKHGHDPQEQQC